jgi:hypothetical protein
MNASKLTVATVTIALWLLLSASCSLQNRDGPNVTCTDLQGGKVNACKDGIIATCSNGAMAFHVCGDSNACDASWQTNAQFRCAETDPIPGSGSGTDAGATDTGQADSGTGADTATAPVDSGGDAAPSCGPSDVCPIVAIPGKITAFAVDSSGLYVTDDSTVWSVPPSGGFTTALVSASQARSYGNIFVDTSYVYVLRSDENRVARVPKTGGAFATVATFNYSQTLAVDATRAYWCDGASSGPIKAQPTSGGSAVTIVSNADCRSLSLGPGFLYWPMNIEAIAWRHATA